MVDYVRLDPKSRERYSVALVSYANSNLSPTAIEVHWVDFSHRDDYTFDIYATVTGIGGATSLNKYTFGMFGDFADTDSEAGFDVTSVVWSPSF